MSLSSCSSWISQSRISLFLKNWNIKQNNRRANSLAWWIKDHGIKATTSSGNYEYVYKLHPVILFFSQHKTSNLTVASWDIYQITFYIYVCCRSPNTLCSCCASMCVCVCVCFLFLSPLWCHSQLLVEHGYNCQCRTAACFCSVPTWERPRQRNGRQQAVS